MITSAEIAALRAADAARTQGEWKASLDCFDCANEGLEVHIECDSNVDLCFRSFPIEGTAYGHDDPYSVPWTDADAAKKSAAEKKALNSQEMIDARVIVAAVNALGPLLDRIQWLETELGVAKTHLERERKEGDRIIDSAYAMAAEIAKLRARLDRDA